MISAVLFDLDDTLLDRRATIETWLPGHCRRFGLDDTMVPRYRARFQELDADGASPREPLFLSLAAEFPVGVSPAILREDFRANAWDHCVTLEGAFPLLERLRADGYRLGVITNGSSRVQRAKVENLGLARFVDTILVSEEEGVHKPDRAIFERALERLGGSLESAMFIGDNPAADIAGARGAGMTAVWAPRHLPWPADLALPTHQIGSLPQLPALQAQLAG
ncbi:MAG TPA: HAD-IA family hydrolase [Gemmatimonadales bacterium]|jgi:putative hydrolase of the HAD superfamily